VSAVRLTNGTEIEVVGTHSGGEVEFVLLQHDGRMWVGTGSDHTDRQVEAYGVTVSKQMCDKPVAPVFWAFEEVAPHWDQLRLRAHVVENGERKVYQEGPVTAMLAPLDLIYRHLKTAGPLPESTLMFCGTLAARGGVRPTERFEFEIEDPVLGRKIVHAYSVRVLPVLG
jgi:2-keto-4-pentenoate hydratase/2-oxohepta-3-ene-1,7-dioic acid hydratase in catechol pathway